jgi:hypothetical protein
MYSTLTGRLKHEGTGSENDWKYGRAAFRILLYLGGCWWRTPEMRPFVFCFADLTACKWGKFTAMHEGGESNSLACLQNRHAKICERGSHAVYKVGVLPHGEHSLTIRKSSRWMLHRETQAVSRRPVTGEPGFDSRSVHVRIVVDVMALGNGILRVLWFSCPVSFDDCFIHTFVYMLPLPEG